MRAKRDYYEVLGVSRSASEEEIRRAFRRLARQYHPDVNREQGAEARFKEINEAYEVLSDLQRRRAYDQFGHAGPSGFGGVSGFEGFGFSDIFDSFFGMGRTATRRGPVRGADLRYELTISFEEAAFGCEKELKLSRWEQCPACAGIGAEPGTESVRCPYCNGTGEIRRAQQSIFGQFVNVMICERCQGEGRVVATPCSQCRGQGRVRKTRRIAISIPAGVDDGSQIRLSGEGEIGSRGGPPGNLYVVLTVTSHPLFQRQGNDLIYETEINVAQAALGDEIEIPTLEGLKTKLRIPPGTESGKTFQLREKGIPYLHGGGRGDILVKVRVAIPSELTEEQRRLFWQLAESFGTRPAPRDDKGLLGKMKGVFGTD